MCGCEATWTCPRHREGGMWQDNGDELIPDPSFDALVDNQELVSQADFKRMAAEILGVPVRK